MTDKVQKIREWVVGIINDTNPFSPDEDGKNSSYEAGKLDVASKILQIIDSLQEEHVSEGLDVAASVFAREDSCGIENPANFYYVVADKARIFKTGAKWQMAQMIKDSTDVTVHIDAGNYPYIP